MFFVDLRQQLSRSILGTLDDFLKCGHSPLIVRYERTLSWGNKMNSAEQIINVLSRNKNELKEVYKVKK